MTKLLALLAVVALAACGGTKPDKDTGPNGSGAGGGSGSATDNGGSGATAPAPLTEDECRQMFGHIVDIALENRKKLKPADPQPAPEQVAALKDEQTKGGMDACLQSPRDQFDCIMAAKDANTLGACGAE